MLRPSERRTYRPQSTQESPVAGQNAARDHSAGGLGTSLASLPAEILQRIALEAGPVGALRMATTSKRMQSDLVETTALARAAERSTMGSPLFQAKREQALLEDRRFVLETKSCLASAKRDAIQGLTEVGVYLGLKAAAKNKLPKIPENYAVIVSATIFAWGVVDFAGVVAKLALARRSAARMGSVDDGTGREGQSVLRAFVGEDTLWTSARETGCVVKPSTTEEK